MAVWRRKPMSAVLIHSDQESQSTSMDWASFLKAADLLKGISWRGKPSRYQIFGLVRGDSCYPY